MREARKGKTYEEIYGAARVKEIKRKRAEANRRYYEIHTGSARKMGFQKGNTPWNKGKPWSEEVKRKISIVNMGKHPSEETKQKISNALKGRPPPSGCFKKGNVPWNKGKKCPQISASLKGHPPNSGSFKKDHIPWNKGLPCSEETKRKLSEANKGKHSSLATEFKKGSIPWDKGKKRPEISGKNHPLFGKRFSEESKQKMRKAAVKRFGHYSKQNTAIEVKIQDELMHRGIKFKTHFPVCGVCQPDIVFPGRRIAVFCDGDYWHNLPENKIKDRKQDEILKKNGWMPLRFWGHEISEDASGCVDKILEVIET